MNPRQRYQAVLQRRRPDRCASEASMMERDVRWLCSQFGLPDQEAAQRFMLSDVRRAYPEYIGPPLPISPKTGAKMTPWGITAKDGEIVLEINGQEVISLADGEYTWVALPPGKYQVTNRTPFMQIDLSGTATDGTDYSDSFENAIHMPSRRTCFWKKCGKRR